MTKTEKAILKLRQIVHHLETNGRYLEDTFLQEAVEDIKSSADLLEMAYDDLRKQECETCFYDHEDNYEMSVKYCFPCRTLGKNCVDHWEWRGDAE